MNIIYLCMTIMDWRDMPSTDESNGSVA